MSEKSLSKPAILSLKEARNIIIQSQKLTGKQHNLLDIIEHIGYLQIDTISVIERAHHHVAWSRAKNYKPEDLKKLEEKDKKIFEYWSHAASYLPMKDYKFSLYQKDNNKKQDKIWFEKDKKLMLFILDKIKAEGPLMSKDFEDSRNVKPKTGMAWDWKPAKKQLWQLFMEGEIMVSGRKGFQKVYDIPERVIPNHIETAVPTQEEYLKYLIFRDIRAHGIIKTSEIGHLLKGIKSPLKKIIDQLIEDKILIPIIIQDNEGSYLTFPETIESLTITRKKNFHILSPFDNILIQRKRTSEIFNFDYTIECYVPKEKRKFGYFGLPLLWGSDFIGKIDLKADRKNKALLINNLEINDAVKNLEKCILPFSKKLKDFAIFNNCFSIEFNKSVLNKIPKSFHQLET